MSPSDTASVDLKTLLAQAASLVVAIGGPAAIWKFLQPLFPHPATKLRDEIDRNVDLLNRLPEGSQARSALLAVIDEDTSKLTTSARHARRDGMSVGLGLFFIVLAVAAGVWAADRSGWWSIPLWVLCATLALFGVVGLSEGLKAVPRDDKSASV